MSQDNPHGFDFAGKLAAMFTSSKLTPLIIGVSILLGSAATLLLPREEEPQIRVPMMDVYAAMPGATAAEVEPRVVRPMEQLLGEIPGVEYVYGTAQPGGGMVIVRFKVGEDVEKSLVKLNQKLQTNFDRIPSGVSFPLVKPASIDDVPILALTLHSAHHDESSLRRGAGVRGPEGLPPREPSNPPRPAPAGRRGARGSSPSITCSAKRLPVKRSIAPMVRISLGCVRVIATPLRPARPVRPMRCT